MVSMSSAFLLIPPHTARGFQTYHSFKIRKTKSSPLGNTLRKGALLYMHKLTSSLLWVKLGGKRSLPDCMTLPWGQDLQ